MNLDAGLFFVYMHGIGGGVVVDKSADKSLWAELDVVANLNSHYVILDIGSYDLCRSGLDPKSVADATFTFSRKLIESGVFGVICLEILPRLNKYMFNEKCRRANNSLSKLCASTPDMYFWTHHRNHFNARFLDEFVSTGDGVHIGSDRGMVHYFRSVRGAVLKCKDLHNIT